jgi:ubiquinol-cytochrome c reductase iron-sulfur subunit
MSDPERRSDRDRGRAELVVAGALGATAAAAVAAIVVYVTGADTQYLGLSLGLAFLGIAVAVITAGLVLYPPRKVVEERPVAPDEEAQAEVEREVTEAAGGISRRRLIAGAAGAAGAAVGGALVVPLAGSLGPFQQGEPFSEIPWRDGVRLVDEENQPVPAANVHPRTFLTAFPEGADKRELAAPVVVIRLPVGEIELDEDRRTWAPEGIMAFSKICTHAGCAISLYRAPLFPAQAPEPALVCPCHYSTFDVRRGGVVIFGPAGRDLPQLPLRIDEAGNLVAAGTLSGKPGPSYLTVREK